MATKKAIAALEKKCGRVYTEGGQSAVYDLVSNQKEVPIKWGYCPGCACDSPVIEGKNECLVCDNIVTFKTK